MYNLYRRVAICNGIELRKDFQGNAAIYIHGKLEHKGAEYWMGRKYLDLKHEKGA